VKAKHFVFSKCEVRASSTDHCFGRDLSLSFYAGVVDWEYGGFNDPLFDIGGLASNNDFIQDLEKEALEMYYEKPLTNDVLSKYNSMKTASLLRETMWSMVSEITSKLDFDYGEYTKDNLIKFNEAFESL
jgi:thiamine kinase-like enzyme